VSDNSTDELQADARVRLLVWDDIDVRARMVDVLVGDAPVAAEVDLERVYLWLLGRCGPGETPEACLFTAVRPGEEELAAPAVTKARTQGFAVLVKIQPTLGRADLSAAMWAHVNRLAVSGCLAEVVVASHDAATFGPRLPELADRGIAVTVLGFRERAGYAAGRAGFTFVDLEAVPGALSTALPRTNLFDLPTEGRVLPPLHRPHLQALDPAPRLVPVPPAANPPTGTAAGPAPTLSSVPSAPVPPAPSVLVPSSVPSPSTVGGPGGAGGPVPAASTPAVIDLTAGRGEQDRERSEEPTTGSIADAVPPPPPPPPPWRMPPTFAGAGGEQQNPAGEGAPSRPGRVMPPNHG
jgi:uncharacterized protein